VVDLTGPFTKKFFTPVEDHGTASFIAINRPADEC